MLKSMTGFGRGEYLDQDLLVIVEIRAVNHRYNEIVSRMPKNLGPLEDKIRRAIATVLVRGRIDVVISIDEYSEKKRIIKVDKKLAIAYHNAIEDLAKSLEVSAGQCLPQILKYADVLKVVEVSEDVSALWPKLLQAIEGALQNLMTMRTTEGSNIQNDLIMRIQNIENNIAIIEQRVPQLTEQYRAKLVIRMSELFASVAAEPDDTRLIQEVAFFADRTNFTEELVRLKSHIVQVRHTLEAGEAVGRKLDFIVQEINREVNTIASKANDYIVANIIIEIKSEIEKCREQIQNIE